MRTYPISTWTSSRAEGAARKSRITTCELGWTVTVLPSASVMVTLAPAPVSISSPGVNRSPFRIGRLPVWLMRVAAPLVAVTLVSGRTGWACAGASAITQTAIAEQNNRRMRKLFESLIDITRDLLKIIPSFRGRRSTLRVHFLVGLDSYDGSQMQT